LQQTDDDGSVHRSSIVSINVSKDASPEIAFKIYPNPLTRGYITLTNETQLGANLIYKVIIRSITGQIIQEERIESDSYGNIQKQLILSELSSGSYYINIYDNAQIINTQKLIINR
jgi:hypothetical protein